MLIEVAVREYLVEIEVRKFTQKTVKSYRNNLNLFFPAFIPFNDCCFILFTNKTV